MTNAVVNAAEVAAVPTAIAVLQAVQAFNASLGTDPLLWPAKVGGAQLVLIGTIQNLFPSLLVSEGAALQSAANAAIGTLIVKLQAAAAAAAPKTP